ncbi:MAG: hypothetical protein LOD91_05700 [Limnochordales bacterium]|nr:ArsB/NhaD family transporter [Limnochordales bacterium]
MATLILVLWRPRGVREVWFAAAGAVAMLVSGAVDGTDVRSVWTETAPVLLFLAGMLVVGFAADRAGVFVWLAYHTARLSGGSGRRLFVGLYLAGVVVTIWFSLDTTAVIMAPIVYSLVRSLGLPPLPFVLATTYVANTASLLLPVSNLTNLIVWNRFGIPFWSFAAALALPAAAAIGVNLLLFLWLFRREIPERFVLEPGASRPQDLDPVTNAPGCTPLESLAMGLAPPGTRLLKESLALLAGLLAAVAAAPFLGWELWAVAVTGGAALTVHGVWRGAMRWRELATGIAWDLLPFVFSLFLVLRGVGRSGLTEFLAAVLVPPAGGETLGGLLRIAAATALGANLINNLPMVLAAVDALAGPASAGQLGLASVYAALLGTNLGSNLTVIGSLATMLALSIIGNKGLRMSGWLYLKVGAATVPLLLVGSVLALWLSVRP